MHFYITGDTHKKFDRVETFCLEHHTTTEDIMIILGDSGINYWLSPKDEKLKERVNRSPVGISGRLQTGAMAWRTCIQRGKVSEYFVRKGRRNL